MTQPPFRPLALIYDRLTLPDRTALDKRLADCREYAASRGCEVEDTMYVDDGDFALNDGRRPQFDRLILRLADVALTRRSVLCLVHDWDRLSRATPKLVNMRTRVEAAGGWTETAAGQSDLLTGPRDWAAVHRFGS